MIPILVKIVEKDYFDRNEQKRYFSTEGQVGSLFVGGADHMRIKHIDTVDKALADATKLISSMMAHRNPDLSLYAQPKYEIIYKSDKLYNHKVYGNRRYNYRTPKRKPSEIIEFIKIEDKRDIQNDDIITLSSLNEKINFPMIKVQRKKKELGFCAKDMIVFDPPFIFLSDLQDHGFKVSEVLRKRVKINKMKTRKNKISEHSLIPTMPVKKGSIASLYESYNNVSAVYEYFEGRRQNGDIFLDQWLADAHKESEEAMRNIKKLIETLEKQD